MNLPFHGLTGIVFDLDGTLYRQDTVRLAMLVRLVRSHLSHPVKGLRTMRVLSAYRKAQEQLRASATSSTSWSNLADAQIRMASERTKSEPSFVAECVYRWMEQEPLDLLPRAIQRGLLDFLWACKARGLRLGVLSDYPATEKLHALGLADIFDVVLTAQAPEIGVFKPHPRGLLLVVERLGVSPDECLYIGDRAEIDARAASAAGVECLILTRRPGVGHARTWREFSAYQQLHELVLDEGSPPQLQLNR